MILSIIFLSMLFLLTNGASRYFISNYTIPFTKPQIVAYPLDVCVAYKVELVGLTATNFFGKFSCNTGNDVITFTGYGTDARCTTTDSTSSPITYSDTTIPDGDLYSFNCVGQDNYAIGDSCAVTASTPPPPEGGAACCGECSPQIFATGVCINTGYYTPNASFSMAECTATTSHTYSYADDPDCNATSKGNATLITNIGTCPFYVNQIFDIYRRMSACYTGGVMISTNSYCVAYGSTQLPESTSYKTTTATTEEADIAVLYYLKYVVVLVLSIAIYIV